MLPTSGTNSRSSSSPWCTITLVVFGFSVALAYSSFLGLDGSNESTQDNSGSSATWNCDSTSATFAYIQQTDQEFGQPTMNHEPHPNPKLHILPFIDCPLVSILIEVHYCATMVPIANDDSRKKKRRNKSNKKPIPLTTKPIVMKSRKRARQVTTQFHKLTHERERALKQGETEKVERLDQELEAMGGRVEYQRASQLSTSFHSTSRWVLGCLARRGWLHGIKLDTSPMTKSTGSGTNEQDESTAHPGKERQREKRRETRILEVGAINTELLDAAMNSRQSQGGDNTTGNRSFLNVRAIDLHSMDDRIEQADFLAIPFSHPDVEQRFDAVVCSMVINCVPTPSDRGKMLALLYHHLRPGGLLFLTLPKYCLTRSAFLTLQIFQEMLTQGGVGFNVEEVKESPKVAFFVCQRPVRDLRQEMNKLWKKEVIRNKGKKFPNQFSVILSENYISGEAFKDRCRGTR